MLPAALQEGCEFFRSSVQQCMKVVKFSEATDQLIYRHGNFLKQQINRSTVTEIF